MLSNLMAADSSEFAQNGVEQELLLVPEPILALNLASGAAVLDENDHSEKRRNICISCLPVKIWREA